ncbi:MAG: trypsin-like peptidase domain-containing protein [bacterium]
MTPGRQIAVIFLSALMGGIISLGGYLVLVKAEPAIAFPMSSTQDESQPAIGGHPAEPPSATNPAASAAPAPSSNPIGGGGGSATDSEDRVNVSVYKTAAPAVVHIQTTSHLMTMFGEQEASGTGSGVIINKEGYILTNNHVVTGQGGRTDLSVTLHDGRELDATFQGIDPETDLAVIKLVTPPSDLPAANLGDSDQLEEGQRAIAIGNPYGLDSSITVGVISALNRTVDAGQNRYEGMIQTDAAVNPGNSGGPLLNARGEVIGINTVIFTQSGGSQGLAFAIPVNFAKKVVSDLIQFGRVQRPYLGVRGLVPMRPALARYLGLDIDTGVLIQTVIPGGPAAKAGIREGKEPVPLNRGEYLLKGGDVILAIDGVKVATGDEVVSKIRKMEVGQTVTLTVFRDGASVDVPVHLEASAQ